jgi:catechol 2,3-dioxygenase-like lactoylglutathione lyase family enzyme
MRHAGSVIGHVGIHCADLDVAARFYDSVLACLGGRRIIDRGYGIGYGTSMPDFWIYQQPGEGTAAAGTRQLHVAFDAADAAAIHAFRDAARSCGAPVTHEPRHWPEYHDHYYGVFVQDPDDNNIEAVCHTVPPITPA